MTMPTNIMVLRAVVPSNLDGGQCFRGTYHLHFQDQIVNQARNQQKLSSLPGSAGFLLGLLFYPEDGSSIFL
jgi:hypothetical protein